MKLVDNEIISHPSHPQHKLTISYTETPFLCDGCKEAGIGLKYACQTCNFDLHKSCANPSTLITHPFYNQCQFRFHYRPPGPLTRVCDACMRDVTGYVYHCASCGFDLHPCCVNLPQTLNDGQRSFYLSRKVAGSCHHCGGKGSGWSYRSECRAYSLHVACVKEMLVESWQSMYLNVDSGRVREMHTKIPSLRGAMQDHHRRAVGKKVERCCQIAGGAVRIIVSAILGDPTAAIAAVIGGFMSR